MSRYQQRHALENVLYEKKGAIAYVTLNRPKVLNALNQGNVGGPANGLRGRARRCRRCAA